MGKRPGNEQQRAGKTGKDRAGGGWENGQGTSSRARAARGVDKRVGNEQEREEKRARIEQEVDGENGQGTSRKGKTGRERAGSGGKNGQENGQGSSGRWMGKRAGHEQQGGWING